MSGAKTAFDYIIVGAGSAGCVLANRLSADPAVTVALLEAGGSDAHPFVRMPRGVQKLMTMPRFFHYFATTPAPESGMKADYWLRGKGLGGSSSVNGMVWVKGQPADFDAIAALGSDDWSWQHIGRAYEELEHHELGTAPGRGGAGPLCITVATLRNTLTEAMVKAGQAMGWPAKKDINQPDDGEGIGPMSRSIHRGKRQSAAIAFLNPIRQRPNLTILTHAIVDKVTFDGTKATGIEIVQRGQRRRIVAKREIILSAGAIASPGILERSGIGDPALLERLGIPLVHANPHVGEHVLEHRAIRMQWRLRQPLSLNRAYDGAHLFWSVARYYLTRGGPMSYAAMDMCAAFRSNPDLVRPDIHAQLALFSWDLTGASYLERAHGFAAVIAPLRPTSEGSIHIETRDPTIMPKIDARYGRAPDDERLTIAAVRTMRRFVEKEPLKPLVEGETFPGPDARSDEAIVEALHRNGVPCMHAVASCRMGRDDASVVDPELRVRGVQGLRVVDTSIFPIMPPGNTNAPTIAMAWRAAEIIRRGG